MNPRDPRDCHDPVRRYHRPVMTKNAPAWRQAACLLTLALAVGTTGCKSAGGSKWAWNPWSKPQLDAATALAGSSPKLPTDGATPLVEGSETAKTATAAIATVKTQTPPAIGGMAPAFDAVAAAVPTIDKPAPEPGWKPYPAGQAAAPPAAKPAATAVASGGPYDPNGYKPTAPAVAASAAGGDRYAAAPASTPDFDPSVFADLPPVKAATETADRYGNRYAAAEQNVAAAADRYATAAESKLNETTTAADRYATQATEAVNSAPTNAVAAVTEAMEQPVAAVAQATSVPAQPAYPSTPAAPAAAAPTPPAYPVAQSNTGSRYGAESATVGTLPPSTSVYASQQPITPIEPATATEPTTGSQGSVVRLTTLPGEYRPGGTSTYPSTSTAGEVKRY